jgi:hypothetical protein
MEGKAQTYKTRLVATSYRQKYKIDFDETFLLIAILKYIRVSSCYSCIT